MILFENVENLAENYSVTHCLKQCIVNFSFLKVASLLFKLFKSLIYSSIYIIVTLHYN